MRSLTLTIIAVFLSITINAQKKVLDHTDKDIWNSIQNRSISNNGDYIMYSLEKGERDQHLKLKNATSALVFEHERAENGKFSYDSKFIFFNIKAWKDSIIELKRKKVKKDKLPKDSLGIYNIESASLDKIANVKSYKIPEKWSGYVAYLLEEVKEKKDTSKTKDSTEVKKKKMKSKKVGKDNGYHMVVRNLTTKKQDTFKYVKDYVFAKEGKYLAFASTGNDSIFNAGVYALNLENNSLLNVYTAEKSKYHQLSLSESGKQLSFVVDNDTTKIQIRPNELYRWQEGDATAQKLLDSDTAPEGYMVSSDGNIMFSEDETKLYFGLRKPPIVKDTTLIDEEIVNVEVWTYDEPRLYTVQELQVKNDKKKSYQTVLDLKTNKLTQIATTLYPDATLGDEGNANYALVSNPEPYQLESQWNANWANDFAIVNLRTGDTKKILTNIGNEARLSPEAKYVYGYQPADSTWYVYSIKNEKLINLTKGQVFYNELNDSPRHPWSYGSPGWTKNDKSLLIYDRYDIWQFDPDTGEQKRITRGREAKTRYRYNRLDNEERFLDPKQKWILSTFNETNKHSGFYEFDYKAKSGKQLLSGPYTFRRLVKAQLTDKVLFSKESFETYPDIQYSDLTFSNVKQLSNANPQQSEYNWGTAELFNWTSLDGIEVTGMLIKPENFDPSKKYPMIVNFYEKSSDGLHRHRAPTYGRSTINYSYYTSNGYVIFNPDVYYRTGYPGESAYNCVIPGVTSLIEKGFIDRDRIGVQGHSWGGYQIAYLVTKTDIFKAAESGAPVPNMISAYGGIRWWTGLSRQFQYEHTQSRIGGTPWEYPSRYIENSPIFNIDKINTPLLIMHNDKDGHVPWYQGIEFFVSLRRLGKPSWFLNYNEEPHWPLKLQNRKDFNIRMAQFFDHYLKDAPKPVWMDRGVPALEKGINQGLELIKED